MSDITIGPIEKSRQDQRVGHSHRRCRLGDPRALGSFADDHQPHPPRHAADRTHLGRFAQDVLDGTAGTLLRRKADAVLGLLFSSPLTALLPLVVAASVYLVVRPPAPLRAALERAPAWRAPLRTPGTGYRVPSSGSGDRTNAIPS